jgi:hypothetical protein
MVAILLDVSYQQRINVCMSVAFRYRVAIKQRLPAMH